VNPKAKGFNVNESLAETVFEKKSFWRSYHSYSTISSLNTALVLHNVAIFFFSFSWIKE